jgi:hypothetical protein
MIMFLLAHAAIHGLHIPFLGLLHGHLPHCPKHHRLCPR